MGAGAVFIGCGDGGRVVAPVAASPIFQSYVALGNSLTAGYQSGGINDSTQQQGYAVLLAKQMHTRFAYPSLVNPGCPPPIANFLTQARVGGASSTSTTCLLRNPATAGATINNVAVPGIASADPTATAGPNGNTLSQLFLGGETMVQKALDNRPTFATVWIGNNDILEPALGGLPAVATPVATFITNYAADINTLVAGAPGLKGVLLGVVQVANAPILFPAVALTNPTVAAAASVAAGRPVSLDPVTCAGSASNALINFEYLVAIQARPAAFPGTVYCSPVLGGGVNDPGDNGVLDVNEQVTVANTINAYNAYIKAKADSIGFAYFDPNVLLLSLKVAGAIPVFPNLAAPTQPFGQYFSLDGIHPTAAAHVLLANGLIDAINAQYGTTLAHVPTS
jgi:lysophospholipase L1-like esterase